MQDAHVASAGETSGGSAIVVLPTTSDLPGSSSRLLHWPASPLRGMRLVITAILVGITVMLLIMAVNAAVSAADLTMAAAIVCLVCLTVSIVDLYRRPGLSLTTQMLHLALTAVTSLVDGDLFLGGASGQVAALTAGLYGSLRQCVSQCVLVQVVITGSVLVKNQMGIDAGMSAAASLQQSVGLAALTALTFSVSAVVGRYERIAARDAIVMRAGVALVAARTCQHIFTSIMEAVSALMTEPGGRAFIARKGHGELLVLHGDAEGATVSFDLLPRSLQDNLQHSPGGIGEAPSASLDGLIVPLGYLQGELVMLVVLGQSKLTKSLFSAVRALGPLAELAFRTVELTQELSRLAFHDTLTGLHNRAFFLDRLRRAVDDRRAPAGAVALLLIDLDGFKKVNDTLGHPAGDELLVETARRLRTCLPAAHLVVRLGGDEFVILMEDVSGAQSAVDVARNVLLAVSRPVTVAGREVTVGASIGITVSGASAASGEALLAQADTAMYRAKARGKGCFSLHDSDEAAAHEREAPTSSRA